MKRAFPLMAWALAASSIGAAAQIPDIAISPHDLRTMTPSALGVRLFGARSPEFTDAWVEGPTRHFKAITVDLATAPRETGFAGLCAVDTGRAIFAWNGGPRSEDDPARLRGAPSIGKRFVLSTDSPNLMPRPGAGDCQTVRPLTRGTVTPPVVAVFERDGAGLKEASDQAAWFAFATMAQSRTAVQTVPVASERCTRGFTDVPSSCGDPKAFARSYRLRQIATLVIDRCRDAAAVCVDAVITEAGDARVDHIVVATGVENVSRFAATSIPVRSIVVRAGSDPIVD